MITPCSPSSVQLQRPCRTASRSAIVRLLSVVVVFGSVSSLGQAAQPGGATRGDSQVMPVRADPGAATEVLLEQLKLDDVHVVHLRDLLRTASDTEAKVDIAERLGRIYVRQLTAANDPQRRTELQARSRELLEQVPEVDSFDLRLDLAKAVYLQAEEIAERVRLRLDAKGERDQAERMFKDNLGTFAQMRQKLHRRVESLDAAESKADDEAGKVIRAQLSEAQRQRSLASYYEGWTRYYIAMLTGQSAEAKESLEAFGVVLNAVPGRAPSIERVNATLLQYEHVARAAIGCALGHALLGNDVDAVRWLERLEQEESVPASVKDQLFSRRLSVLGSAQRWSDIESAVRRHRAARAEGEHARLSVAEARLLAIHCFESKQASLRPSAVAIAEELGQIAFADLIAAKELQQVVDLCQKYGTVPLGERGFVVACVRGLLAYEQARAKHLKGASPDGPTSDAALQNEYRAAAAFFQSALQSDDVDDYPSERSRVQLRLGLSQFYAGDVRLAADAFEEATNALDASIRQDATWFAIVALDKAIEGGNAALQQRRDRLAMMHIQQFPRSVNSAALLLHAKGGEIVNEQQRLELLLTVPRDSPVAKPARRTAASLLYARFRAATPGDRETRGRQLLGIAESVLREEIDDAAAARGEEAKELAQHALLRARQVLDVMLAMPQPETDRAEAILASIDRLASSFGLDLSSIASELALRRLQLALARRDDEAAARIADELAASQDQYATAGARLMFRTYYTQWSSRPSDMQYARRALGVGSRVLDGDSSPALAAMRDQVAGLAAVLWREQRDVQMRAYAIRLDEVNMKAGVQTESILRRSAELHEDAGDFQRSCDLWSTLMQGLEPKSTAWYESRWNSLRVLAKADSAAAWAVYQQYRALYPDPAPEPWHTRITSIGESVRPNPASVPGGTAPVPSKKP